MKHAIESLNGKTLEFGFVSWNIGRELPQVEALKDLDAALEFGTVHWNIGRVGSDEEILVKADEAVESEKEEMFEI